MKSLVTAGQVMQFSIVCAVLGTAPGLSADDDNRIRTIVRRGERVVLEGYLLKGKYTLFEFYADWSPAWKKMGPEIEAQVKRSDEVVLRRINVRSWTSPVVSQHQITAIPHYKLYDPDGKLMKAYSPEGATKLPEATGRRREEKRTGSAGITTYKPPPEIRPIKVSTISPTGASVDIKKHLARGQFTLVEFYADW